MDAGLVDWVGEAMAPVGTVTHRAMMGGATLYCDGTVFAIVAADGLWFKLDDQSAAAFDAAGCERFSYTDKNGRVATMRYARVPDDCLDDADALRRWGILALEAGRRAPVRARRR